MYKHGYKYYSVLLKAKGEQTTVCARNEKMSTSSGTRRWSDQIPATMERRNDWRRLFFYLRVCRWRSQACGSSVKNEESQWTDGRTEGTPRTRQFLISTPSVTDTQGKSTTDGQKDGPRYETQELVRHLHIQEPAIRRQQKAQLLQMEGKNVPENLKSWLKINSSYCVMSRPFVPIDLQQSSSFT